MAPAASPKRDEQTSATIDGSELFRSLLDKPIKSEPTSSDMSRLLEMPPRATFNTDFAQWQSMQFDQMRFREMEQREMQRRLEEMQRIEYERYQFGQRSRRVCPICLDPRCGGSDRGF